MGAALSLVMKCSICGTNTTISGTSMAARAQVPPSQNGVKCAKCGNPLNWEPSSVVATHSTSVASNTTITLTVTEPGSLASAVS